MLGLRLFSRKMERDALKRLMAEGRENPVDPREALEANKAALRRQRIQLAVILIAGAAIVGVVSFFG